MSRRTPIPARRLDDRCRGELWLALGRSLDAGLPLTSALAGAADVCDGRIRDAVERSRARVERGTALPAALRGAGLLGASDRAAVEAADASGRLGPTALGLARRYEARDRRWRRFKGRMLMPLFVLGAALVLLPLPALVAGRIGFADFALASGAMALLVVALAVLGRRLLARWNAGGWPGPFVALAERAPLVGPLVRAQRRVDLAEALAHLLGAGLDASSALRSHARGADAAVAPRLVEASRATAKGRSLSDALAATDLLDAESLAVLEAGETAGRVDPSLARFAELAGERLDDTYDSLARLLPVIAYLGVAAIVAAGLLG